MRFFLHQSETSVILFCSLTSISFSVFPLVSRDESSANREFLTFLSYMCSGGSFMNMQNRRGPNILPCGTPVCIAPTADRQVIQICLQFFLQDRVIHQIKGFFLNLGIQHLLSLSDQ